MTRPNRKTTLLVGLAALLSFSGCWAAWGVNQGRVFNAQDVIGDSKLNAVATSEEWLGEYVQVSGTVLETGFLDITPEAYTTSTTLFGGTRTERDETVRYPFVVLAADGPTGALSFKCVLNDNWARDLRAANVGKWLRASAHIVSIDHASTPPSITLRECRVREIHPSKPVPKAVAPPRTVDAGSPAVAP